MLAAPGNQPGTGLTQIFWALLGTWILGLGFFHYRAFGQKRKSSASNPSPALDVKGLYLATGTGFFVSLAPLLVAPSALTAIVAALFTIVGLGTAKIAAEEWARLPATIPQTRPKAPIQPPAIDAAAAAVSMVQAELQTSRQESKRRGNRQKRRGK